MNLERVIVVVDSVTSTLDARSHMQRVHISAFTTVSGLREVMLPKYRAIGMSTASLRALLCRRVSSVSHRTTRNEHEVLVGVVAWIVWLVLLV